MTIIRTSFIPSILIAASLTLGCSALPKNFNATETSAIPYGTPSAVHEIFEPDVEAHPGSSGFFVLDSGRQAFLARMALAELAEESIDCQYYIWKGDRSGILLMSRLVKAADRGVRVRLLLDDLTTYGKDLGLSVMNQHPNIEIRLFNPLSRRYFIRVFRTLAMALNAKRMTNRMHNKIFVVDNQVSIVGGRNIGDEYFGISPEMNFRDLDLMAVGPIADDVSNGFDDYWNSPWSVPFEVVKFGRPSKRKAKKQKEKFNAYVQENLANFPYSLFIDRQDVVTELNDLRPGFIWAPSRVLVDAPGKAWKKAKRGTSNSDILNGLEDILALTKNDVVIMSPYFIIPKKSVEEMGLLVDRGVRTRVYTNSLASTDAVPVVAMYRKLRVPMLREGVEVYEIRPDAAMRTGYLDSSVHDKKLSLHGKAAIFDLKTVFVGTFNMDPRSEYLNTEVGLLVESPDLARKINDLIEKDFSRENCYSLTLDKKEKNIIWRSSNNGDTIIHKKDPKTSFWLRFKAGFFSMLPIRSQL